MLPFCGPSSLRSSANQCILKLCYKLFQLEAHIQIRAETGHATLRQYKRSFDDYLAVDKAYAWLSLHGSKAQHQLELSRTFINYVKLILGNTLGGAFALHKRDASMYMQK